MSEQNNLRDSIPELIKALNLGEEATIEPDDVATAQIADITDSETDCTVGSNDNASDTTTSSGASAEDNNVRLPPGYLPFDYHVESEEYHPHGTGQCLFSKYGVPHISPQKAAELLPPIPQPRNIGNSSNENLNVVKKVIGEKVKGDDPANGLIYKARVYANNDIKLIPPKDWDATNECIKPRRGTLSVLADDFFSSLIQTEEEKPRWLFSGVLNGWPSLVLLEVRSIHVTIRGTRIPSIKKGIQRLEVRVWSTEKEGQKGVPPKFPVSNNKVVRYKEVHVKLRAAAWTSKGWSKASPGYMWWFEAQRSTPRLLHGEDMIRIPLREREDNPVCVRVHMFSHRYAMGLHKKENPKDRFTYHTAVLLEWDHQEYCTVVELALLNGIGGYGGKSNWFDDKNSSPPALYRAVPKRMVAPWSWEYAEIRCQDVEAKNLLEFKKYIWKYTGHVHRFVDPKFTHSHDVRLSFRSKDHITRYLLNYIGRDRRYSEVFRNCQTFAADLYGFLVGKKGIEPFTYWNRIEYQNRSHMFLYQWDQYEQWD